MMVERAYLGQVPLILGPSSWGGPPTPSTGPFIDQLMLRFGRVTDYGLVKVREAVVDGRVVIEVLSTEPDAARAALPSEAGGFPVVVRRFAPPAVQARAVLSESHSSLGSASSLTDATFSQALSAPKAVVDFWSPTCPYCVAYKPVFEEVAAQYAGQIPMFTGNVDEAPASAGSYNIEGIPATIFLVNGKEVHREEGNLSKADLVAAISKAFGGSAAPAPAAGAASKGIPTWGMIGAGLAAAGIAAFVATR